MGNKKKIGIRLASSFVKGERKAVGEVYESTYRLLYFQAIRIVDDPDDAFDLVHDLFTKALEGKMKAVDPEKLVSYLVTSIRNSAINLVSRRAREEKIPDIEESGKGDPSPSYFEDIAPYLDKEEAEILIAHLVFSYSMREIAEFTGKGKSTVHDIYKKALKKAEEALKEKA